MIEFYGICFSLMLAFVVGVKCGQGWHHQFKLRRERDPEAEAFVARMHAGVHEAVERKVA